MAKYSFIVPVYNTEKYLDKCLRSLVNQTFKDFEIIIINDGSTDGSKNIISKYQKFSNVTVINQANQGLSETRNNGVKKSTGEYLIFIDSDDYVEKDLLKVVDENVGSSDVLRYQVITEDEDGNNKKSFNEAPFSSLSGPRALGVLANYKYVELACLYVFKRTFWNQNNFSFMKGKYHEDFGLIPYVVFCAASVSSVDYPGYHYVQRKGSIMNDKDYQKEVKKANDILEQYLIIKKNVNKDKHSGVDKSYLLSFLANSVILKARYLKDDDLDKYLANLKSNKVFDDVKDDGIKRKLKKLLMKLNVKIYLKVVK